MLPSGMSYRYLRVARHRPHDAAAGPEDPRTGRGGARVIGGKRLKGSPGLTGLSRAATPRWRRSPRRCGTPTAWSSGKTLAEVFAQDRLQPDFEGEGLQLHPPPRRRGGHLFRVPPGESPR